jgi:cytochrome c peroxidase
VAYRDPESDRSTSSGTLKNRFGPRNAPTIMYARYVPSLHSDGTGGWIGGLFWDGRGGSLEQQPAGPLLNPAEMNNPDKATVVRTIRSARYAGDFEALYGPHALDDVDGAFVRVGDVLAAFERTSALAPFSSKYDRYLAHTATLTPAELRGLAVFEDPAKGNCASCHPSRPAADGTPPLFTNFSYANLGIPRYVNSQFYVQSPELNPAGRAYVDHGLMTTVNDPAQDGKFRTPTLRNIARTGPYGHNGYFENLPYMLDFLNTRDTRSPDPVVKPWAAPEVPATVDARVGHLGLTSAELDDLDTFLETLTDARAPAPKPR